MYSPCHFENRRNYAGARRAAQLALSVLLCILALAFAKDAEASMAPVITSATTASGVVGTAFSYQITATNTPTGYGATGLPNGLSVNTTSGLISGTPSGAGVSTVALSATNSGGTGTATLTLTILGGGAGPLVSHTIQISSDADDGYYNNQDGSGWHSDPQYGGADLVGSWGGTTTGWVPGYRFPSTGVNSGDTIRSAYLRLMSSDGFATSAACGSAPCPSSNSTFRIYGVAQDDGTAFSGTAGNTPLDVPYTTAYTDYTSTGPGDDHGSCQGNNNGQNTCTHIVDVTSIVKEISARPGWTSASAMRFVMLSTNSAAPNVYAGYEDYSANPGKAATLVVNPPVPTLVSSGTYGVSPTTTYPTTYPTGPFVYPGASTLLLFLGDYYNFRGVNISQPSVTDNCGNTWNILAAPTNWLGIAYYMRSTVYYVQNPASCPAGDTITVTVESQEPIFVHFLAVAGSDTTQAPVASAITSPSPGTYTTSATSDAIALTNAGLLVSWIFGDSDAAHTFTPQTGFITDLNSTPNYLTAVSESVSSPGSYQSQFAISPTSDGWQVVIIGLPALVAGPPVITSSGTANATAGAVFSYQIAATNTPTGFGASGLPTGLTVNTASGLISGTPTGPGSFNVTVSATNNAGTSSAPLTLTVTVAPPVITSSGAASGTIGSAFSYQITAANLPISFGASGLPPGLTVNSVSGLISGTLSGTGVSTVTLSATNIGGTGTATLTLTVAAAPAITSATTASGTEGSAFSYQITATNAPSSYGATGLPAGLTVNSGTGLISGTLSGAGTSSVTLSATNSAGTGTAPLTLTIAVAAPVITISAAASGTVGSAFSYQIMASNAPSSYGATGLPAGLTVNSGTGLISGTPSGAGTSSVTLSATNSGGTGTATLTLTIAVAAPVITSSAASGTEGNSFSYQIAATNAPSSYGATGLPAGLAVNSGTGLISGTPSGAGVSTVALSATNSGGTGTATLTLTILGGGAGPLVSHTIQISSDADDGYYNNQDGSGWHSDPQYGGADLVGSWGGTTTGWVPGYRFPSTGVNSGDTIRSAYLRLMSSDGFATSAACGSAPCPSSNSTFRIYGVAQDDGTAFSGTAGNTPLDVPYTTAYTDYTSTGPGDDHGSCQGNNNGQNTCTHIVDVTSIVKEISARPGWTSASAMRFVMLSTNSAAPNVYAGYEDYSANPGKAATLVVNPPVPTLVSSGTYGVSPTTTYPTTYPTGPFVYPGASTLLLFLGDYYNFRGVNISQPSVTDNCGNTWNILAAPTNWLGIAYYMRSTVYYVQNPASCPAGDTITVTVESQEPIFVHFLAVAGSDTTQAPLASAITSPSPGTYTTSATSDAIALTNAGLLVSWIFGDSDAAHTFTPQTGFITDLNSTPNYLTAVSESVSSPGSYQSQFAISPTSDGWQVVIIGLPALVAGPPVITSSGTANATAGAVFSYQIAATNTPTGFGASGLPTGLTVNTASGLISGTPTGPGAFNVTVSATNNAGTSSAPLTLTVTVAPPVITSSGAASGTIGSAFSYQITAANLPISFGASGLPPGLTVNSVSGLISGTLSGTGVSTVTLSATNIGGTGTATLTLTVAAAPAITSATTASGTEGSAFSYQITATNAPSSYGATGLPAGLMVNSGTGLISGTLSGAGVSTVTLSATNSGGTGTAPLTLTILGGGAGPLVSHTIQISSDADDGYYNNQDGSGWHSDPQYGGADLVGSWGGTTMEWVPGYRFPSTGVNSGDTIRSAYLQLVSSDGFATSAACGSAPCPSSNSTFRVYGVAQDDGTAFSGTAGNTPLDVPYTTAYTDYTSTGPGDGHGSCQGNNSGQNTCTHIIDVTSIVKEITARPGWTSTSAMRFVMMSTDSTAPNVFAGYEDYSANPSRAATLIVNPPLPTIVSSGAWGTDSQETYPTTYSTGPFVYPGASTLLLFLGDYYNFYGQPVAQPSVSDSCGNTWNILAGPTNWVGIVYYMRSTVYSVQNPASCPAGDTITITADYQEPIFVHFLAVAGSDTTQAPVVSAITSPSPGTYTTSATSSPITLTNAGLLVSWIFGDSDAAHTFTPQTGFFRDLNSTPNYLTAGFEIVSSPNTYQSQFAISPADGWQVVTIGLPALGSVDK